jgi:hypothetical protein
LLLQQQTQFLCWFALQVLHQMQQVLFGPLPLVLLVG